VNQGKFLEHARYGGELYGTLRSDVQQILDSGRHVLLDIEVRGAEQVRKLDPNALSISYCPVIRESSFDDWSSAGVKHPNRSSSG